MKMKRYALGLAWGATMAALLSGCAGGGGIKIEPCPSGHTGVKPFCLPVAAPDQPPAKCEPGFHGTPPACVKDEAPVTPPVVAPPAKPECKFPQGLPESAFHFLPDARNTAGDKVNQAADTVLRGFGDVWGGPQHFFAELTAELRARGYCAGQHREGHQQPDGSWDRGSTDEIAVRDKGDDGKPVGPWQAFHAYQGPDANKHEDHGQYLRSPQSFRGAYEVDAEPAAGPPVSDAVCPLPLDFDVAEPITRWASVVVEPIAGLAGQWSIKTAWCSKRDTDEHKPGVGPGGQPIQALAPAGWGAPCGTQCCRVGIHEARVGIACEKKILGDPLWVTSDGVTRGHTDNPFNFKVAGVSGTGQWIKACGSAGHACSAPVPVQ